MGFLTLVRKRQKKNREVRLLLLGLDNAGKSTVLNSIIGEDVGDVQPTFGFQIKSFVSHGALINFWDVGGQESFRPFWKNYFERTDGIIWVIDGSDAERFPEHIAEFTQLLHESFLLMSSILVLVNKSDLYGPENFRRICELLEFGEMPAHMRVFACSAMDGSGVQEAMEWFMQDIMSRKWGYGTREALIPN